MSPVHVLTITDFPLACRKQTLFSALVSSAIFSAGETRAEKSVCPLQATAFRACASKMVYLMVTFEKEIPVMHFRFTHLSWLA